METRIHARVLSAAVGGLLALTLNPVLPQPAAAADRPRSTAPTAAVERDRVDGQPDGLTDITDGLPGRDVSRPAAGTAGGAATAEPVATREEPDQGVARGVRAEAADGGRVDVIIRLREQVDLPRLTETARAAGTATAVARRRDLAARDLPAREVDRRVSRAAENARSRTVVDSLQSVARRGRAEVATALGELRRAGHAAKVRPFWVFSGFSASVDETALERLAAHPDVASVTADETIELPEMRPESRPKLPTWGLERVRATDVWARYDNRGEGVVVGIMDSGVDGEHPALASSWRGRHGDPAKSWYVATSEDYPTPGDGFGHGTHVAGTMVGGPPGEVVGVAPEATWIAAKIFNDGGGASTSGIHRSFEWMLAPGGDPTASPDLVNNSWGSAATYQTEFWDDVEAWVAAGIVPIFANGNDGPASSTVGSPGSFPQSFAVGATDVNDVVAGFSSRGPVSWDGVTLIKPQVSAPGHHIVSALPTDLGYGEYGDLSGTSMATPHVSGVTALLLAANPTLTVEQVEDLLTSTARPEPHMGDLPDDDYGHGIVDAFAAVTKAGSSGTVSGTVTTRDDVPVSGAELVVDGVPWTATTATEGGAYQIVVPAGTHTVRVTAPGLETTSVEVTVGVAESLLRNIEMRPTGSYTLSGRITHERKPVAGAAVSVTGLAGEPAYTNDKGIYQLTVPGGQHEVRVRATGYELWSTTVTVTRDQVLDVTLDALAVDSRDGWAEYQNNPAHTGLAATAVAPETLRRQWSVDTGPGIVFSSPVVADGTVYVGSTDGQLEARDLETGELRWSHDVGDQLRGAPAVADGTVVIGGGVDGGIVGLDAATGEQRWRVETPGQLAVYTQPTIVGGTVYANSGPSEAEDSLYAIDLETGAVLWSTAVAAGLFNGPASDGSTLYVTSAYERSVTALDRTTGEVVWTTTRPGESFYSAPSVAGGTVFATTTSDSTWDGALLALDATDGSLRWAQPDHGDAQGSSPAIHGDLVITGTHANGAVVAYDRTTGAVAWRHQDSGPVSSSLMVTGDGYVIGGSQLDSVVFALDAATGRRVWLDDVGANVTSSGAYDDGTYVTADTSGRLYAYRTTGSVTGRVTGAGDPLAATLEVEETGASVDTDPATGEYGLDDRPGDVTLRASSYGYVAETRPVTILAGRSVTVDLDLAVAGVGSVSGTVVDAAGTPLEGASVTLQDTPLPAATTDAAGSFAFPEVAEGDYRVRVVRDGYRDHAGQVSVTAGQDASLALTLERYRIAVTGDYEGIMVDALARAGYAADTTTYDEVISDPSRYEVVFANGGDDEPTDGVLQAFVDATDGAGTSVVWLDQWSLGWGSIGHLSEQTGDPAEIVDEYGGSGRVSVVPTAEHPLTEGLTLDARVPALAANSDWSAFNGYSGTTVASLHVDEGGDVGSAIAYQPRSLGSTHVLLSTLAAAPWGGPDDGWLPVVDELIGNAAGYALDVEYGAVEGTVTDGAGAPVADGTVVAVGTDRRATTTADGGYRLLLDPGTHTLRFRAPGRTPVEETVTVVGGQSQRLDVVLSAAELGSLAGVVTGEDGAPVAGATVRLPDWSGAAATTAADGSWTITDIPAETYTLEVTATDHLTSTREVTVVGGRTVSVDIVLRAAPRVGLLGDYRGQLGTLLAAGEIPSREIDWEDTAALADLDVVVVNDPSTPSAAEFDAFLAAMDHHGVSGVFTDGYFSSDGGVRFLREHTGNPSQDRTRISDAGDIRFRGTDPGHPLFEGLGAEPQVLIADSYATAIPGYTGFPLAEVVSERNGDEGVGVTYQPRTEDSVHLLVGGLTAGTLVRTDEDWTGAGRRLFRNAVLFAAAPPLGTVGGTVTDGVGNPVPGTVSVEGTGQRVTTAGDGGYALHLPPGTWTVRYAGFGYAPQTREVVLDDDGTIVNDVSLQPADGVGSISGTVTSGGDPLAGATVRLLGVPRSTTTAADGSWSLPLVEPGDYRLDVTAAGHLRDRSPVSVAPGEAVTRAVTLRVTARVGVVDDYQGLMTEWLDNWGYTPQPLEWDDTAALTDLDLVVANMASYSGHDPTRDGLQAFDEAALRAGVSVVWLDQFGRGSFRYLSGYTGDPGAVGQDRNDGPVTASIVAGEHPVGAGLPDSFPLVGDDDEYSWFEDFSGRTLVSVAGDTGGGGLVGERPRGAAGVDVLVGTLSMSTYGSASYDHVEGESWTPEAERLLRNAVRYALDAPPAGGQVSGTLSGAAGSLAGTVTVVETGRTYHVDGDGEFLVGLPTGVWTLRAEARYHDATEVTVEIAVGDRLDRDLTLVPLDAGTVAGTVTDEAGAAAAGVTVQVGGTDFTATTDATGAYSISGVPAGDYVVVASGDAWQTSRAEVTVVADQTATVDLVVGATIPVAVVGDYVGSLRELLGREGYTVTDYSTSEFDDLAVVVDQYDVVILNRGASSTRLPDFEALLDAAANDGVSVILGSQWGGDAIASLSQVRDDPQNVVGDFVPSPVSYVPAGRHPIFAGFPAGEPVTILDDPDTTGDNQQYSVFDGYSGMTLAGVRADGDGSDLGSGVGVRYSSRTSVEVLLASLTAGIYGRPGEEWTPAAERIYLQAVAFAATAERGEISGTVTGDGAPLDGATVRVGGGSLPSQSVTTDDAGHYAVGVTDGTYTVTVSATGFARESREVTVRDNAVVDADFVLQALPRGDLTGVVTDDDGRPVAGATLSGDGEDDWTATTAADGSYRATGLLDGSYQVTVTAPGHLDEVVALDYVGPSRTLDVSLTRIDVGVLGDVEHGLVDFLREEQVAAGPLEWSADLDLTGYEVVVVNGDGGDPVTESEFDELEAEAARSGVGLVWGGTWGSEGGLRVLEQHDDGLVVGAEGFGDGAVRLTDLEQRAGLFAGLTDPARILVEGSYWSTIADYDGKTLATQRVALADGSETTGIGAAWSWTSATDVEVLLSSQAATGAVGPDLGWTEAGEQLFLNAVELARHPSRR